MAENREKEALEILKKFNRLRNDLDAYLYEVIEWGLGMASKPDPKRFGVE